MVPTVCPTPLTFVKLARTVTNLATGESVTEVTNLKVADLKVTDTGDGTLTFIALRPARDVYIQDGRVIARGGVVQRIEGFSDHGGTPTDPSDDEFLEQVIINGGRQSG